MSTSHDRQIVAALTAATRVALRALQGTPGDHVAALKRIVRAQNAAFAFMRAADLHPDAYDAARLASNAAGHLLLESLQAAAKEMRELVPGVADGLATPAPAAHRAP